MTHYDLSFATEERSVGGRAHRGSPLLAKHPSARFSTCHRGEHRVDHISTFPLENCIEDVKRMRECELHCFSFSFLFLLEIVFFSVSFFFFFFFFFFFLDERGKMVSVRQQDRINFMELAASRRSPTG